MINQIQQIRTLRIIKYHNLYSQSEYCFTSANRQSSSLLADFLEFKNIINYPNSSY